MKYVVIPVLVFWFVLTARECVGAVTQRKPISPNWWPVITFALIAIVIALYSI